MRVVELLPAAVWTCPTCGKRNFETMVAGTLVHGTNHVECPHCESEFATNACATNSVVDQNSDDPSDKDGEIQNEQ